MTTTIDTPRTTTTVGDIGMLALRIGVGATLLQAGIRKLVDFGGTVDTLEKAGWKMPGVATLMVSVSETVGGAFLILGLLTPLAACAALAVMIDAWLVNVSAGSVWADPFNHTFVLALGSLALLFAGAGGWSLDARLWRRYWWPAPVTVTLFLLAAAAAAATWVFLNGTNPIHT